MTQKSAKSRHTFDINLPRVTREKRHDIFFADFLTFIDIQKSRLTLIKKSENFNKTLNHRKTLYKTQKK